MSTYMIRYIIPVPLRLPESASFNLNLKGAEFIIRCNHLEGACINSYLSNETNWINKNKTIFKVSSKNNDGDVLEALNVYINDKKDFQTEGYIEVAQYTMLDIVVLKSIDNDIDKLIELSASALNEFIEKYKYYFYERNIGVVSAKDSRIIHIFRCTKTSTNEDSTNMDFEYVTSQANWQDLFKIGFGNVDAADNRVRQFYKSLKENENIASWLKLLLDAREKSVRYNDHNTSIILAETALEVYLQNKLINECQRRNILKLPSGKNVENESSTVIISASVTQILKKLIPYICNTEVAGSKYYNEWNELVYDKRNQIVHKGIECNEQEAEKSFIAVQKIINYINQVMLN